RRRTEILARPAADSGSDVLTGLFPSFRLANPIADACQGRSVTRRIHDPVHTPAPWGRAEVVADGPRLRDLLSAPAPNGQTRGEHGRTVPCSLASGEFFVGSTVGDRTDRSPFPMR